MLFPAKCNDLAGFGLAADLEVSYGFPVLIFLPPERYALKIVSADFVRASLDIHSLTPPFVAKFTKFPILSFQNRYKSFHGQTLSDYKH